MANRLSDDDLRKQLRSYGENVGPITPTTRSTLERRLTSLKRTHPTPNSSLNAFSSDDSEIENSTFPIPRKKRTVNHQSSPDSDIFKKPAAVNVPILSQEKRSRTPKKAKKRNSTFEVDTSESEFDSDASSSMTLRLRRRPLASLETKRLSDDSPEYEGLIRRKPLNLVGSTELKHNLHQFSSPILDRLRRDHSSYQSNGYLSGANGDFNEEKVGEGQSTNYSHCVSWVLLLGVVSFFFVIGLLYMTEVQKTSQTAGKNYSKFCLNITKEEECKSLISISRELHSLLTTVAGDYDCGSAKARNLSVVDAKKVLRQSLSVDSTFMMKRFDEMFEKSLSLFKNNAQWGVKFLPAQIGTSDQNSVSSGNVIFSALEATQSYKSVWCRVRMSLAWTATKLLLLAGGVVILLLSYLAFGFWKKQREAQERLFYEMVEKVIDILQEAGAGCKAVVNVRDSLIPAKERRQKQSLWDRVVAFIEENESRVSVEYQKINGEDFKVWRWHPCSTPENEAGKQAKVWQGQAFSGKGKTSTYTPSPCLKIRNMFDPEVEYGSEWHVSVKDAILEKCEGNDGIVHIAFDFSTNNEGCVFMKCISSEAAGKAYNDLHGWWFDGKLVTVKYLKLSRYLERFPEADDLSVPLRPSNDRRLSLSTPFFSSALERS